MMQAFRPGASRFGVTNPMTRSSRPPAPMSWAQRSPQDYSAMQNHWGQIQGQNQNTMQRMMQSGQFAGQANIFGNAMSGAPAAQPAPQTWQPPQNLMPNQAGAPQGGGSPMMPGGWQPDGMSYRGGMFPWSEAAGGWRGPTPTGFEQQLGLKRTY